MKRTTAIIMSVVILMMAVCNAFAANTANRIHANPIIAEAGETVTIPVKIENNEGFMGFAVFVTYDKTVFRPISATKGAVISGLFNDSISTSKTNTFKVVCSETGNVTADGVLFNLNFDVLSGASGKHNIELSYSQQDTFNENWDNVIFSCEDIDVVITKNGTTAPTTVITTAATTRPTTVSTTKPTTRTTTQPTTTRPTTTVTEIEETTTRPTTEPTTNPVIDDPNEELLSVRLREWVNGLPMPFNIILGIFVVPATFFISLFE